MLCAAEPGAPHCRTELTFRWLVYQQRRNSPADEKNARKNRHDAEPLEWGYAFAQKNRSKKNGNGSVERREHGDHRNLFDLHTQITKDECAGIEKGGSRGLRGRFRVRKSERRTLCSKNPERNERSNSAHQPNSCVSAGRGNDMSTEQPKHDSEKDGCKRSPNNSLFRAGGWICPGSFPASDKQSSRECRSHAGNANHREALSREKSEHQRERGIT